MALESGKVYQIINIKSGTVLDVDAYNGYNVIGWQARDKGGNQHWKLEKVGDLWTLFNISLQKYLGIAQGVIADGFPVFARDEPFDWNVEPLNTTTQRGEIKISIPGQNFDLDLSNDGASVNGTYVILWTEHGGDNQLWQFVEVDA